MLNMSSEECAEPFQATETHFGGSKTDPSTVALWMLAPHFFLKEETTFSSLAFYSKRAWLLLPTSEWLWPSFVAAFSEIFWSSFCMRQQQKIG